MPQIHQQECASGWNKKCTIEFQDKTQTGASQILALFGDEVSNGASGGFCSRAGFVMVCASDDPTSPWNDVKSDDTWSSFSVMDALDDEDWTLPQFDTDSAGWSEPEQSNSPIRCKQCARDGTTGNGDTYEEIWGSGCNDFAYFRKRVGTRATTLSIDIGVVTDSADRLNDAGALSASGSNAVDDNSSAAANDSVLAAVLGGVVAFVVVVVVIVAVLLTRDKKRKSASRVDISRIMPLDVAAKLGANGDKLPGPGPLRNKLSNRWALSASASAEDASLFRGRGESKLGPPSPSSAVTLDKQALKSGSTDVDLGSSRGSHPKRSRKTRHRRSTGKVECADEVVKTRAQRISMGEKQMVEL